MAWRATKKRQEAQINLLSAIFTVSKATLKKSAETPKQKPYAGYATKEQHAEVLTQVWLTNAGFLIDASDGESPPVPLGTDAREIPDDHPRRGGV